MFYAHVFRELNKNGIRYMVIGGIAVNLHGYSRITGDLDIMLWMNPKNLEKFIKVVKALGFKPRVPVGIEELADPKKRETWIKEKNMKVFTIYNPKNEIEHIDIMTEDYINFDKAYDNHEDVLAGDITISVISIDDLIHLKKIANRPTDQIDINVLEKIKKLKNAKKAKED